MLTRDRAKTVSREQAQWPYWGNYSKFMTEEEIAHVKYIVEHAQSGNVSFAAVVEAIKNGDVEERWPLREGTPTFEEMNPEIANKD